MGTPGSSDVTLYQWVKSVYESFGHQMPTQPNEVALLGVREVRTRTLPAFFRQRLEFSQVERQAGLAAPGDKATAASPITQYDDLLFRVQVPNSSPSPASTRQQASADEGIEIFRCSIDPGKVDKTATRIPLLCEGQLYHVYPGKHQEYKINSAPKELTAGGTSITALHVYSSVDSSEQKKVKRIMLARINEKRKIFESVEDILPRKHIPSFDFTFCGTEDNDSIHIHFTTDNAGEQVSIWSTGCTVLKDVSRHSDRYKRHLVSCVKAGNAKAIPYLVVSSKYLKLFDGGNQTSPMDFVSYFSQKTGVLVEEKLTGSEWNIRDANSKKVFQKGYVPSFATRAFFDSVERLSGQLQAVASAIRAGKSSTATKLVSAEYQKIAYIKELLFKKSLGTKEAETAEKWSRNLMNSLKHMGFYLPTNTPFASPSWGQWTPKS